MYTSAEQEFGTAICAAVGGAIVTAITIVNYLTGR
jgi:hypothetical protein